LILSSLLKLSSVSFFVSSCPPLLYVADPMSVQINMGDDEIPHWVTTKFHNQAVLKEFINNLGAGGLQNGDENLVHQLADLKDGGRYTLAYGLGSGFSKLKEAAKRSDSSIANAARALEHKVMIVGFKLPRILFFLYGVLCC
jgi:hypothetical protein